MNALGALVADTYCSRSDNTWLSWSLNDDGGILLLRRRLGYIQLSVFCPASESLSFELKMLSYELLSSLLYDCEPMGALSLVCL